MMVDKQLVEHFFDLTGVSLSERLFVHLRSIGVDTDDVSLLEGLLLDGDGAVKPSVIEVQESLLRPEPLKLKVNRGSSGNLRINLL